MNVGFSGTYADLVSLAEDDIREAFATVDDLSQAQAVLDRAADLAVAKFQSPLAIFQAFPETLGHDFGSLTFEHGDTVGDALRRLAQSMIRENLIYEMNDALWTTFEGGAYAATKAVLEGAIALGSRGYGISEYQVKTVRTCLERLSEEGVVEQPTWSILQGAYNGSRDLFSAYRRGHYRESALADFGGPAALERLMKDAQKLAYLMSDDRDKFVETMADAWAAEAHLAPSL